MSSNWVLSDWLLMFLSFISYNYIFSFLFVVSAIGVWTPYSYRIRMILKLYHTSWNVICWYWSIMFLKTNVTAPVYQYILEHFMLPSADQLFKDADFIFQQDLAPAHTAKSTKSWLNDHGVGVAWLASKLTRPEPRREYMGYCEEENEKQETKKFRWAEGHCQRNLGFHTTSAVPQLITSIAPQLWWKVVWSTSNVTRVYMHL